MQTFKIKTLRKGSRYETPHFYIPNKGKNAGRPSKKAFSNSFVVFGNTAGKTEKLYWICRILHCGNYFKPYLVGSCVEFVHIGSVKKLFTKALKGYFGKHWQERFKMLQHIEKAESDLKLKAAQINRHKVLLMRSYESQLQ